MRPAATTLQRVEDGRIVNQTPFGKELARIARDLLTDFLETHDYGFQDGGCAIFAQALHLWSGRRLTLRGLICPEGRVQHVVACDGRLALDGDGLGTIDEAVTKLALLEHRPGCRDGGLYDPASSPNIPWDPAASERLALRLADALPPPGTLPWLNPF